MIDLTSYDLILLNTSGGKDSALMSHFVVNIARHLGIMDRVAAVHATFPEEWPGTVELVQRQCQALGITRLHVVSRGEGLLDYAKRRGKWPSPGQRWCTSDFKRAPINKVITELAPRRPRWRRRRPRVLNVLGMRASESPERAKMLPFSRDAVRTNTIRTVDQWLPIFRLATPDVWALLEEAGLEMHPAYAAGMPRLSCSFCIYAPKSALVLAGKLRPDMLRQYVEAEREMGHTFKRDLAIKDILAIVEAGGDSEPITDWRM